MYCFNCRKEIDDNAEICVYCGVDVSNKNGEREIQKGSKYCTHCGALAREDAVICINCGCLIENEQSENFSYSESKTGIGVLMALFLGVVGLIIGICLYPNKTVARETFVKGWLVTFIIDIVMVIFFILLFYSSLISILY